MIKKVRYIHRDQDYNLHENLNTMRNICLVINNKFVYFIIGLVLPSSIFGTDCLEI